MFLFNISNISPLIFIFVPIAVIILIVSIILVYFLVIKRRRERRTSKELEKKYVSLHQILTEDIEQYIARLDFISNQNTEYIQYHEKYYLAYQEILQENDRGSYIAVNGLRSTVNEKKHKGLKNLIDSTRTIVNEFDRKVTE